MSIQCPYCLHLMELKGASAGRFTPRCPSCRGKFILVVHHDASQAPTVAPIPGSPAQADERLPSDIEEALGIERSARSETARGKRSATDKPRVALKRPADAPLESTGAATLAQPRSNGNGDSATLAPPSSGDSVTAAPPPADRLSTPAIDPAVARGLADDATLAPPSDSMDGATVVPSTGAEGTFARSTPADEQDRSLEKEGDQGPAEADEEELHGKVGGYEIIHRLGRGGMGSVYLANQLSLARNVALKTLLKQLAADAQFVARFTREAYAAAQLVHHNVVQIYDIGEQRSTHFFSMEFVEGKTLGAILREQGRLDPQVAVGYILQAARGLKFAHEHGMVHRDIKPDNLLLNRHGIVKVADLGLVKVPDTKESEAARAKKALQTGNWYDDRADKTDLNVSMGTPAYMPPEQAQDATHVDQRADIYSLGCTLYTLLVGEPPFRGRSAEETIQKHLTQPFPAPEQSNDAVGPTLSYVIQKMCAKRPEDRYANMGEVIEALENLLGVETSGDFTPREEQTRTLESCIKWFNDAKWVGIRTKIIFGFFAACGVLILSVLFARIPGATKIHWAGGLVGFALLAPVMYVIVSGLTQKTYLFAKVRQFVFGAGIIGWLIGLVIGVLAVLILVALNLHWFWLAFAGAALVAAMGLHFLVDSMIVRDRRGAIDNLETLLKGLRTRGVPEPAIEQFVCKYGGENWEEIYETLFGYESKMIAREKWGKLTSGLGRTGVGDRGRARAKYAAWRDPIIAWIDEKEKLRRAARERRHLEKIEAASLRAKGFGESAARKKAKRTAESLVIKAGELREEAMEHLLETAAPQPTEAPAKTEEPKPQESPLSEEAMERRRKKKVGADDEGLEGWEHLSYFQRRYGGWQGFFLGSLVRFGLGAFLLFGGLLWAHQNDLLKAENATALLRADAEKTFVNGEAVKVEGPLVDTKVETHPLDLKGVPTFMTSFFDHWSVPLAGLLLLLSAIFQGTNLGVFLIPSAAIMVLAPHYGLPGVGPLSPHAVGAIIGVIGSVAGLIVARK